jgi:protein-tyrosine phosphatase
VVPGPGDVGRYNPHVHFLFVCTANICRSPMAAALLTRQIQDLAEPVQVSSAGVLPGGSPVPDEVLRVMAPFGIDLTEHRSQTLSAPMLQQCDLVIGMGRRHIQEAILLDPPCWPQVFTLKELVRRSGEIGPRRPGQGIRSWIEAAQGDRTRDSLAHRAAADEIADPYGHSFERYQQTAAELTRLTAQLAGALWPDEVRHPA